MLVVELGLKLDKELIYYDELLKEHRLKNVFNCNTHDLYYTNTSLDGLTENQMKENCIRLRNVNNDESYKIQNSPFDEKNILKDKLNEYETFLLSNGYKKVFDTKKKDHHYFKEGMNSRVQLQEIDDIGLILYYDNSNYYELPLEEQRKKLIDELNSYGFNFSYDCLGLDKLRTLYYKKEMYSNNQNG